ncbi:hypothetical protein IM53_011975 [Xanthomonas phaseoli pv. dieffenbachiae]|uniref:Uncharacterized protein n=1 Tax=Xanthomonas phaseoli pv. dieffenbachiae TaxID=92828 RepID=A0A1V9H6L9_9XANT|nr:hypothetical protein IM53_011975 [Xanthomonas phaseoli pv. dieffenbachiae]
MCRCKCGPHSTILQIDPFASLRARRFVEHFLLPGHCLWMQLRCKLETAGALQMARWSSGFARMAVVSRAKLRYRVLRTMITWRLDYVLILE